MVCAVLCGELITVSAQSLAEVARKEEQRRGAVAKPSPIYTNKELKPLPSGDRQGSGSPTSKATLPPESRKAEGEAATDPSAVPADGADDGLAKPVKARDKRDERHWRERATLIRDRLDRLRRDTSAVQSRMTTLRAGAAAAPKGEAVALSGELAIATADFNRFETERRLIEQEWTTFEQRARTADVPPHWLQR